MTRSVAEHLVEINREGATTGGDRPNPGARRHDEILILRVVIAIEVADFMRKNRAGPLFVCPKRSYPEGNIEINQAVMERSAGDSGVLLVIVKCKGEYGTLLLDRRMP
jgi:hypothetical protein